MASVKSFWVSECAKCRVCSGSAERMVLRDSNRGMIDDSNLGRFASDFLCGDEDRDMHSWVS